MSLWERMVQLNEGGAIKVAIEEYKGVERFDVRYYYWHKKAQAWTPTQKGVMIPIDKFDDVVDAFVEAKNRREGVDS